MFVLQYIFIYFEFLFFH